MTVDHGIKDRKYLVFESQLMALFYRGHRGCHIVVVKKSSWRFLL